MKWHEVTPLLNGFGVSVLFEKDGKVHRYDGVVDYEDRYVIPVLRNPLKPITKPWMSPPDDALVIVHTPTIKALGWD